MEFSGTVLSGKYKLLEQLGRGGMGEVYEAQHLQTERHVAVKLLHADLAEKEEARVRFEREAKAAGRIDHDNVCEVIDFGVTAEGSHYLVMPLLRGHTLDEVIEASGQLPIERAGDIASQILEALSAAHGKGIVHRDLKPGNIFLTKIGDRDDFVKVLDFGITKFGIGHAAGGKATTLTSTGSVLGTPFYMAPEQARGDKDIDGRVDLYSTGVIIYEMLTGQRPVTGEKVNEVLWKIWNAPIQPPKVHRPDLGEELDLFTLKAMARDPGKRFPSAEVMQSALNGAVAAWRSAPAGAAGTLQTVSIVEDEPARQDRIQTVEDSSPEAERGAAPRPRRWWPFVTGGAAVVSLAIGGTIALGFVHGAQPIQDDERTPQVGPADPVSSVAPPDTPLEPRGNAAHATPPEPEPAQQAVEGSASPEQRTVTISLQDVPDGAEVSVDGRHVEGTTLELQRGSGFVNVVVQAAGYQRWAQAVSTERDATIGVALVARPHRAGKRTGPGTENESEEETDVPFGPTKVFGQAL